MNQFNDKALVVLGAPRSGTTLIATALGAHPRIVMLSEECESGVFKIVGGKLRGVKLCIPVHVDLDRHWRVLYEPLRRSRWLRQNVNYRLPRSRLSLREMAERATLIVVGVLRDPGSTIEAITRRTDRNERIARDMLRRTYDVYERLPGELGIEPHFVSFDRFVREPEAALRRLCDRLELAFDPAMLDAPRLNPSYPEATFRADRAAAPGAQRQEDAGLAALRARYEVFLKTAL
jgi:hypothetical protein